MTSEEVGLKWPAKEAGEKEYRVKLPGITRTGGGGGRRKDEVIFSSKIKETSGQMSQGNTSSRKKRASPRKRARRKRPMNTGREGAINWDARRGGYRPIGAEASWMIGGRVWREGYGKGAQVN